MILAKHPAKCPACEEYIEVGDPIVRDPLDGDPGAWIHETCPKALPVVREICGDCFTEKSVSGHCLCGAL